MLNRNTLSSGFYLSNWLAVIPLLIMVLPTIYLSTKGVLSAEMMVTFGVIGLMVGALLSRDSKSYWGVAAKSLAEPTGILILKLFLIVGIYSQMLTEAKLTDGIIWLTTSLQLDAALYPLFVYVICSILGTAMGTSLGTIMVMTPILYPAAYSVGAEPFLVLGAILSGAATGDHFAPVSDTTIISSSTQSYKSKEGCAEVSDVVKGRFKYVIPAFVLACIGYVVCGYSLTTEQLQPPQLASTLTANPLGLVMLLPMCVVVGCAVAGKSVYDSLTWGIVLGLVLALSTGLLTPHQLLYVEQRTVKGVLVEGVTKNINTIMMILLMMGAYGIMKAYGVLQLIVDKLQAAFARTVQKAELTMMAITLLLSLLLIGLNTRVTAIAGPIVNELGAKFNIHPVRRANLLDATANSLSYIVPWNVWPLIMIMFVKSLLPEYPFLAVPNSTIFFVFTFYPLMILAVMTFSVLTGKGRKQEEEKL
ncbi:Na+/H+ antiporter NhaC family protein [Shewanella acanthi]|uniref:Na+/H+ antiporter NhaC family protein n=1 Tax=Shewanella acanthi TaxID=2864212 RepID=UPI001C66159E|nr:Na+/H+ antiporter NhaC family protein [Shewanella acanthi]QYJ80102.1 hypothetical protein K0H61_06855 [Shewanella acanthi]